MGLTALGAGAVLRRLPDHEYPGQALALGTIAGAAADAFVVSAGHPWPGLVAGVGVFASTMALLGRSTCPGSPGKSSPPI